MKIAIVAYHFPPDPAVGSVRPASWARWLAADHDVVVITKGDTDGFDGPQNGYRVRRTQPLAIRLLSRAQERRVAARVRRASTHADGGASRRPPRPATGVMTYRMPCLYDAWGPTAYRALGQERPDLVIGTHSPYVDLLVAAGYASRHRHARAWLDYRDMWTFGHATTGMPVVARMERCLEQWALRHAAVVTSCSQGFCRRLQGALPSTRPMLVYNSPGVPDAEAETLPTEGSPARLTIAYTGNVYPWQDVTPLWRALGEVVSSHERTPRDVCVEVASRLPGSIVASAVAHGLSAFVRYRGALSRAQSVELQRGADVLLLMESSDADADGVLHAKVFEYLATDKPILLLGSAPGSELSRLLQCHGRLVSLADVQRAIATGSGLPRGAAVDFAATAKQQLLGCIADVERRHHARTA